MGQVIKEQVGGGGTWTEEEVLLVWTMRRVGGPWLHNRKCRVSPSPSDRMWTRLMPGGSGETEELRPGFNSRDNYTHKHAQTHAHTFTELSQYAGKHKQQILHPTSICLVLHINSCFYEVIRPLQGNESPVNNNY